MSPNLAILLTPPGVAALAVVRLSGPAVHAFLEAHFSRPLHAGRIVHGTLRDGETVLDDPVIVLAPDRSWADISLHGGTWVVQSVLKLAQRRGFELVQQNRGEPVPPEAVEATSDLEREIISHLPLAGTDLALRLLLAQESAWRRLQSQPSPPSPEVLAEILSDRSLHWLLHPPRLAIVGPPNVGKSTLANRLFAQERSITANLPGTTRDWVGELANLDGLMVLLVDTPGLRETEDPIEQRAIQTSAAEVRRADLVMAVVDASRPQDPDQQQILSGYPDALIVCNKSDLALAADRDKEVGVKTVATTGEGVEVLIREIRRRFGCDELDLSRPRCWTDRQRAILNEAILDPKRLAEI